MSIISRDDNLDIVPLNYEFIDLSFKKDLADQLQACSNKKIQNSIAGIYLTTNEGNLEKSRQKLLEKPITSNACHIGFSGWHNFNIMAQRKSQAGVIVDFNPNNEWFINTTVKLLTAVNSREEFLQRAAAGFEYIYDFNPDFFSPNIRADLDEEEFILTPSEEIEKEGSLEGSWLFDEDSFGYIQNLARQGRIVAITEDICNTATFKKIVDIYHKNNFVIDTVYTSNICDYMRTESQREAYRDTVYTLLDPEATLIDCPIRESENGEDIRLEQRVSSSKEIQDKDVDELFFIQNELESSSGEESGAFFSCEED